MSANGMLTGLARTSTGHKLRADAAGSYERMATAFRRDLGYALAITDGYRDLAEQVAVRKAKGKFAAVPGTSNHGWGIALDLGAGVNVATSVAHRWMDAHASEYGWVNPPWAQDSNPGNGQFEPWHWEYVPALDQHDGIGDAVAARPTIRKTGQTMPIIYHAGGYPALGVLGHNGGWANLTSQEEYNNLVKVGVPAVWVEKRTLDAIITDSRA